MSEMDLKKSIGKDLRRQFRKYLCIGIYQHLKEKDELKRCFKQLQEILEIDENDEQISNNRPKNSGFIIMELQYMHMIGKLIEWEIG